MRIAWIVYGALEQPTGGYIYDAAIVTRLRAAGDWVEIVSIEARSDPAQLARTLMHGRYEAIVGDALAVRELGGALPSCQGPAARVLLVHHLTSWEYEVHNAQALREEEARAIAASDHLVATSAWTAGRLAGEYGRTPDVVVAGSDRLERLGRLRDGDEGDRRVVLVFVGGVVPRKRLALLLDAMDRASPNLELRVIGDLKRDPAYAALIRDCLERRQGLRKRVALLGLVGDNALARELALADALVLPSSLEGYGMVLAEALHAGVPVIATRMGPISEIVGRGDCALLFDGGASALGALLTRFGSEPMLRERMRAAAEARAPVLPTWDQAAAAFRNILTRAVAAQKELAPSIERVS
jgi:glycosyltransferase involved in cell wall biosynthesis